MKSGPLTICAVGRADSVHVASRTRCFAELGHRVLLVSHVAAPDIPGVTQFVPSYPPRGPGGFLLRVAARVPVLGRLVPHAARAVAFVRLLHRWKPDVIHVHYAYSYYGWLAAMLGSGPIAVTVMGGDVLFEEQGAPTPAGKWLTIRLLREARYITTKSNHLTAVLERFGGVAALVERIVWGIPLRVFHRSDASSLRARLGISPTARVVLSPKILQPFYRVHLIVEAMPVVLTAVPDAVLVVTEYAADPDYRERIARRAAEMGIDRHVIFCGHVSHHDMPAYYSLAEVTVAVPSSDGLPQTLLEGMACETPSILGKLPRYEELVTHGRSAWFVDAEPAAIAQGVIELMRNPALRTEIARNALAIVREQADLDAQAAQVERRLREIADGKPRPWSLRRFLRACAAFTSAMAAGASR